MESVRPIGNGILFNFLDNVIIREGKTIFEDRSTSGIILDSFDNSTKYPRWGTVIEIGNDVDAVDVGDEVLIEWGQWTTSIVFNNKKMWKTDESAIMATRN